MAKKAKSFEQYLVEYIVAEKPASVSLWVPEAAYKKIAAVAMEHGPGAIKAIYLALEEKVPYEQIRVVAAHLRSRGVE